MPAEHLLLSDRLRGVGHLAEHGYGVGGVCVLQAWPSSSGQSCLLRPKGGGLSPPSLLHPAIRCCPTQEEFTAGLLTACERSPTHNMDYLPPKTALIASDRD